MKMAVFWLVAPCNLVEVYRRFGGTCCCHLRGDGKLIPDYVAQQPKKTAIFMLAAVRTSNLTRFSYFIVLLMENTALY
jgi:hypothetical protein